MKDKLVIKRDQEEDYAGVTMEVAGIESCGFGVDAPRVKFQSNQSPDEE